MKQISQSIRPSAVSSLLRAPLSLLLLLCLLGGCTHRSGAHSNQSQHRLTIAVIPMATTDEHWKAVHAGAVKAARELDVDIVWQGTLKYNDRSAQADIVENMRIRPVDGIVLAPIDDMALRGVVEDAYRSNIPVAVVDSRLSSERQISFIATDNYKGGYLAGQHLSRLLNSKGTITMLRGNAGNSATFDREEGFLAALKESPGIKLLGGSQRVGATLEEGYKSAENLLAPYKHRDGTISLDGIFCPNEMSTFAMLRALQDNNLLKKVHFVGFDTSKRLDEALVRGDIEGLVVQNPYRMGYDGVKTMVAHLRGNAVERRVDTGVVMATPENAEDPEIAGLLAPNLSILREAK